MERLKVAILVALVTALLGTMGFFLTKDSFIADHTSEETMLELKTNQKAPEDTLEKNKYTKVNRLIDQYYEEKAGTQQFAEGYQDIAVYTMPAEAAGDYIAYVTYKMEIKDVDTLLPGMETFYIEASGTDTYEIADVSANQTIQDEISTASQKEEVRELIQSVEDSYIEAKENDPTLAASLDELKKAYQ
ncbi:MAG: hypothetical protein PHQ72_04965 [Hespellia sp.]|nr:hypothetical protein [Hespellia sp.]